MTRRAIDDMYDDPRTPFQMLGRADCKKILTEKGINFDPGITQMDAVVLLQANQINPMEAMKWERISIQGPDGRMSEKLVPLRTDPVRPEGYDEKALAEVDRLSALAIERDKKDAEKVKSLESEVSDLKEMVERLLKERKVDLVESEVKVVICKETDPYKMKYMAQKKWLKDHGIHLKKGDDVKSLIAGVLEKENEDTPTGD